MNCLLCNKTFSSLRGLHSHISKAHKTKIPEYYYTFYPKYDLYTKDLISYKDYNHYNESDFNSRDSFSAWLSENYNNESAKIYCLSKIKQRMSKKLTTELPPHVALKSLFLPSIHGFSKIYGSINSFVENMASNKINLRYDYTSKIFLHEGEMKIFQDTREQAPLQFKNSEVMKLTVGDYTPDKNFYSDVYVDRKSLVDLAGTLTAGKERLEREIQRAKDLGFYLIFVVEDLYSQAVNYSANNSFSHKLNGAHIMHEIRDLLAQYDNIQFVFSGNRSKSVAVIENIFRLKEQAKSLDLEYLKDIGAI